MENAPDVPVVVVDNASRDGTLEQISRLAGLKVIANSENRGFAAAVNQGVGTSDADFLLLLNPDVRLLTGLDQVVAASQEFGLAAGKLTDKAGNPQLGFTVRRLPGLAELLFELFGLNRLWPSNPVNRRYRCFDMDVSKAALVEQPAGAFLMFRRDVWQRLRGFDESFFPVWFEDVDFCRRALDSGYQIAYVPEVVGQHEGGHSVLSLSAGCRHLYWCDSLLTYAAKHFRSMEYRGLCIAVGISSVPRAVLGMIEERSLSPAQACIRIIRLAGRRFFSSRPAAGLRHDP
jgi:N-acetylglucosaminyl-diphospho-decaprenol L-rhamnosyltransferase